MQPLVASISEAAVALGRNRDTIYKMIREGTLQPVRYGGRQSIPVAQLHALAGAGDAAADHVEKYGVPRAGGEQVAHMAQQERMLRS